MPSFSSHPCPTQIPYDLLFILFGMLCRDVDLGISIYIDTNIIDIPLWTQTGQTWRMGSNIELVIPAGLQLKLKGIDLTFERGTRGDLSGGSAPARHLFARGKTVNLLVEDQCRMWRPDSCSS